MLLRILSAAVLIPVVLAGVIYATPWPFLFALGAVGTICLHEYFALIRSMGLKAHPLFGYAAFWILIIGLHGKWLPAEALIASLIIAAFLDALRHADPLRDRALGLMGSLLGLSYPALFLYPALPIRFEFGEKPGLQWFILLLITIWVGDSMALLAGRKFGKTPFAAVISPKKTNEGAMCGLLGGIVAAVLLQRLLFRDLPLLHVIAISSLAGIFGQLGDLAESMLKRAAAVKDSSHLIPGHGGVLDRIDSLLFAFPVAYLYLLILYRP